MSTGKISIALIRITILGFKGCGKSSLVNCFVNNSDETVTESTQFPELYYRVLRLSSQDSEEPEVSVCVEIEDTPYIATKGSDERRNLFAVSNFYDMTRTSITSNKIDPEKVVPFNIWNAPLSTVFPSHPCHVPLSHSRMGYMILFEAGNIHSLEVAMTIHASFLQYMDIKKIQQRPHIFFIATKMDRKNDDPIFQKTIQMAEEYTSRMSTRLIKVSTITFKNVDKAFRALAHLVLGNQTLWIMDIKNSKTKQEKSQNSISEL